MGIVRHLCIVLRRLLVLHHANLTSSATCAVQLLLAGANSGQLSHKDIYVFSKSYVACLDYSSVEVPDVLPCCQSSPWSSCLLQACARSH
jgi:hypothetical protein